MPSSPSSHKPRIHKHILTTLFFIGGIFHFNACNYLSQLDSYTMVWDNTRQMRASIMAYPSLLTPSYLGLLPGALETLGMLGFSEAEAKQIIIGAPQVAEQRCVHMRVRRLGLRSPVELIRHESMEGETAAACGAKHARHADWCARNLAMPPAVQIWSTRLEAPRGRSLQQPMPA